MLEQTLHVYVYFAYKVTCSIYSQDHLYDLA